MQQVQEPYARAVEGEAQGVCGRLTHKISRGARCVRACAEVLVALVAVDAEDAMPPALPRSPSATSISPGGPILAFFWDLASFDEDKTLQSCTAVQANMAFAPNTRNGAILS